MRDRNKSLRQQPRSQIAEPTGHLFLSFLRRGTSFFTGWPSSVREGELLLSGASVTNFLSVFDVALFHLYLPGGVVFSSLASGALKKSNLVHFCFHGRANPGGSDVSRFLCSAILGINLHISILTYMHVSSLSGMSYFKSLSCGDAWVSEGLSACLQPRA